MNALNEKIIMMDVKELIPYDKNPRKNEGAVDAVANSIKEFGFKVPIIVDKNNVIITGHYFVDDRSQDTVIEPKLLDFKKMKKDELIDLLKEIFSDKTSTSVLHEDKTVINDLHPTMKPIKLLARLIKNSSKKGENVLDLFSGSGSTLIACEQLGRNCYMMELDPKYVDIIIKRWELFTGKKAEQIN